MHKKAKRFLAFLMSGLMVLSSFGMGTTAEAASVKTETGFETTYSLSELSYAGGWGAEIKTGETATTLVYTGEYQEVKYSIPSEVIGAGVTGFKVNLVDTSDSTLAVKLYDSSAVTEDSDGMTAVKYEGSVITADVVADMIGIMSLSKEEYVVTAESVTFFTKEAVSDEVIEDEAEIVTYSASELTFTNRWVPSEIEEGSTLHFDSQYKEFIAVLPEAIPFNTVDSVTVKISEQGAPFCVKLYDNAAASGEAVIEKYGFTGSSAYTIPANIAKGSLCTIGIMSHVDDSTFEVTIEEISIKLKEAAPEEPEEPEEPSEPSEPGTQNELVFHDRWNASKTSGNTLTFDGRYQEYVYDLPEAVAAEDIESLIIKVSNQGNNVCVKLYDSAMNETPIYSNYGKTEYEFHPASELAAIGIMSMPEGADNYPYSITIDDIVVKTVSKVKIIEFGEDMTLFDRWNSADTTGNEISFSGQYNEFILDLGEEIYGGEGTSVKIDVSNQGGNICFKLLDSYAQGAAELYCNYSNNGSSSYVINTTFEEEFRYLAVMSMEASGYPYGVTVEKVTVTSAPKTTPKYEETTTFEGDALVFTPWSGEPEVEGNTLTFQKRWNEYRFELPTPVKAEDVLSVKFTVSGQGGSISFKTYDGDTETSADYDKKGSKTYTVAPGLSSGNVTHVSVMAHQSEDTDGAYPFSVTVEKIEITIDTTPLDQRVEKGVEYDIVNLRDEMTKVMGEDFIVGTAISTAEFADSMEMELVTKHFNAVTLGNELKPDSMLKSNAQIITYNLNGEDIQVPELDFSTPDRYLDFFVNWNNEHPDKFIKIRGHVLVWHSQTPEFFFHEDYDTKKPFVSTDVMNKRLEYYIKSVCEHYTAEGSKYKSLFYGWDVVNEAISDNSGTYRNGNENSVWWRVYNSPEFINNAFVYANKYMPANIALFYNDYNAYQSTKSKGICALVEGVLATEGARIDGVGMQGHYYCANNNPTMEDVKKAATAYGKLVSQVQFTEVDFKESTGPEDDQLAKRYKDLYDTIRRLVEEGTNVTGFTVWGVVDKHSWLQTANGAGGGSNGSSKQYPLLFDNNYKAKKSFYALVDAGELTPEIKNVNIVSSINDDFALGEEYTIKTTGDVSASFVPMCTEDSIKVLVKVLDADVDDSDAVIVYAEDGNGIKKVTVSRKDAKEVAGGFEAEASVSVDATTLAAGKVKLDVVVVDGDKTFAFNDTTMSQDEKADFYATTTVKPLIGVEKGTVTIDGDASDAAWAKAETITLNISLGADAKADAKLLWDEEKLYVLMNVEDSVLNKDSSQAHEQDSVEIFIDENNNKSGAYEADDKQYRINYENTHSFNGTKCVEENIESVVTLTENGYLVEAAFKWTDIDATAGALVGLELQVNDADASGSRKGTLSWADKSGNGWSSTEVFGTIYLNKEAVKNGIVNEDGVLYYYVDGKRAYAGAVEIDGDIYYVKGDGSVAIGSYYVTHGNGIVERGHREFDENGKMILSGVEKINGEYYYYVNRERANNAGMIEYNQYHYYIGEGGKVMTGEVEVVNTNGHVAEGTYTFRENGVMVLEGIVRVDGSLRYYVGDRMRSQAGMIVLDGDMYYVGAGAVVATGKRSVGSRHNGLVTPGIHYFDEETGKFIK